MLWPVMAAILTVVGAVIVPRFAAIVKDFGVALPPSTELLIGFSSWFVRYGWVVVWALSFVIALVMSAATWRLPDPWRAFRITRRILLLLLTIMILLGAWALCAPMLNLITAVSQTL